MRKICKRCGGPLDNDALYFEKSVRGFLNTPKTNKYAICSDCIRVKLQKNNPGFVKRALYYTGI